MTPSRRTLLTTGGAMAAVAVVATVGLVADDRWAVEAARHASVGADILVIHGAAVPAGILERALRTEAPPSRVTTHRLTGLSGVDFGPFRTALVRSAGCRLFALVDDVQALMIETVLSRSVLSRRPVDIDLINAGLGRRGLILLTGTIQE